MEIQTIQSAVAGVHRINEFFSLEELPEKTDYRKESTQKKDNVFVEFQNVTFAYEEQKCAKWSQFSGKRRRTGYTFRSHRRRQKYDIQAAAGTL